MKNSIENYINEKVYSIHHTLLYWKKQIKITKWKLLTLKLKSILNRLVINQKLNINKL